MAQSLVLSEEVKVSPARWRRIGDLLVVALAVLLDLVAWGGDLPSGAGQLVPAFALPAITVAVYSTLLLRWRRPLPVFGGQWVFTFGCLLVPDFEPIAGLLVALHAVAARRSARWSVAALLSTVVPFSLYSDIGTTGSPAGIAGSLVLFMVFATAAWGVGRLSYVAAQRNQRLHELQAAEAAAAVQAERMRLARELHDIVAHTVTIMMIQATGARAVLGPGQPSVERALAVIEDSGVQAMSELHRMLNLLRMPDGPEPAAPALQPSLADLQHLVGAAVQAGRDVSLVEDGVAGLVDPSVAGAAYRVVQESLTNAAKHGGPQAIVRIRLEWSATVLEVEVIDSERGPKLSAEQAAMLSSGHGLRGLHERVTMVGGTLEAGPVPGGYVVRARLPLHGVRPEALLGAVP